MNTIEILSIFLRNLVDLENEIESTQKSELSSSQCETIWTKSPVTFGREIDAGICLSLRLLFRCTTPRHQITIRTQVDLLKTRERDEQSMTKSKYSRSEMNVYYRFNSSTRERKKTHNHYARLSNRRAKKTRSCLPPFFLPVQRTIYCS